MIKGDISNNLFYTAAFDFRLLIDIHYPFIFSWGVATGFNFLIKLASSVNKTELLNLKQNNYDNKVILVTHSNIKKYLESLPYLAEYEVEVITGVWEIAFKDYRVLYTPDLSWVTVYPNMAFYVSKVSDYLPKSKLQKKILDIAENTLRKVKK